MTLPQKKAITLLIPIVLMIWLGLTPLACDSGSEGNDPPGRKKQPLVEVKNTDEFRRIVSGAGNRLLLFDLYADWCLPCKELEPILEAIAWEKRDVVDIYRINYDSNNSLAGLLGVRGIPFVAFIKNETLVYSLMGLRPQKTYIEAISSFTRPGDSTDLKTENRGIRLDLGGPPASQTPE